MKNTPFSVTIIKPQNALLLRTVTKVLLSGLLLIAFQGVVAQSKYVKKFRVTADSLSAVYGVPASIILGVAIMESGSGTSRNCKLLKNHFGIVGKNNLLKTKGVKTRYKQYPDDLSSYVDFCKLMTKKKFYKRLKENMDHKLWADAISKAGYSEIPDIWKQRLLAIIKNNKLSSPH